MVCLALERVLSYRMLLSNDVGQPLAGRLILWIEAKMIVDQMCWVQTVLGYTALGYTALEVLVHGLHFFRRGGTAFEGRPIWVLVLLKRWIIFDECQFANWRVSAGEGQGKQSGHPRQHPCDPLRQRDNSLFVISPPCFGPHGSVCGALCITVNNDHFCPCN